MILQWKSELACCQQNKLFSTANEPIMTVEKMKSSKVKLPDEESRIALRGDPLGHRTHVRFSHGWTIRIAPDSTANDLESEHAENPTRPPRGNAGAVMKLVLFALVALLAVPLTVAAAPAKKPPSFALWSASESNHEDSLTGPVVAQCQKAFGKNDLKAGECVTVGLLGVYPKMKAYWARGVARIAVGQSVACRRAIHTYWVAATKNFAASIGYLQAHRKTPITDIQSGLAAEPYATLKSVKDEAKSRAVRVCG